MARCISTPDRASASVIDDDSFSMLGLRLSLFNAPALGT
jgi:hypothetical protein